MNIDDHIDDNGIFYMSCSIERLPYQSDEVYKKIRNKISEFYFKFNTHTGEYDFKVPSMNDIAEISGISEECIQYKNYKSEKFLFHNVSGHFRRTFCERYNQDFYSVFSISRLNIRELFSRNKYLESVLFLRGEKQKEAFLKLLNQDNCLLSFVDYIEDKFPDIFIQSNMFDLDILARPELAFVKIKGLSDKFQNGKDLSFSELESLLKFRNYPDDREEELIFRKIKFRLGLYLENKHNDFEFEVLKNLILDCLNKNQETINSLFKYGEMSELLLPLIRQGKLSLF